MDKTQRFLELHRAGSPLLMPNPWDAGSAKILESLGFAALATTSSGFAMTLGRLDGSVTRDEAIEHGAAVVAATSVPVSADLENCFAHDPAGVAETIGLAVDAGLAGCSIEDYSGEDGDPIYDAALAHDRVEAAVDSAAGRLVLTARCENFLHDRTDLNDTIARLQSYQDAGADVLYAPGLVAPAEIAAVLSAVDRPVNVLLLPSGPSIAELTDLGVHRISLGGTLAYAMHGALARAGRDLRDGGTGFFELAAEGRAAVRDAF